MDRLPEEILRDILAYDLRVPHAEFLFYRDWHGDPPALSRPACHLLVSKRWLRVGTPLLYECMRLKKPEHTAAIAQLFRAHPHVGAAVRCLRLEGGFGKELAHVAKHITGLRSLYVDVGVKSADSVTGLKKALGMLSPVELYIRVVNRRDNKKVVEVRALLYAHIRLEIWSSLRIVSLSSGFWSHAALGDLAGSLAHSSVEEFVCDTDEATSWMLEERFQAVIEFPTLQRVIFRGIAQQERMEQLLREKGLLHADKRKFAFVHDGVKDDDRLALQALFQHFA